MIESADEPIDLVIYDEDGRDPDAKRKEVFLTALSETGIVRSACAAAGVSRNKAYRWRNESPVFRSTWDEHLEEAADLLEEEAWNRARNGSDTLLIFLLKGLRPSIYNDKVRHEHFNKGPQEITFRVVHELQGQQQVSVTEIDAEEGSYHQLTDSTREADSSK